MKFISLTFYSMLAWFLCINGFTEGEVMLSPVGVASVCPGDQLQLICTTSGQFVEWTIFLNARNNSLFISSMSGVASNFSVPASQSTTLFIASRNSTLNSSPLISVLSVHPIGSDLDGVMVICGGQSGSSTAVIDVIAETDVHFQVNITLLSEQFVSDSVLVILEWNQRDFYSYSISVTPQLEYTADNARVQLNVPYNAFYNVNIIASPPCEQNSSNFIELHYYICRNPASNIDSPGIEITGLRNLSVEGAVITFSCPNGSMLIGQTTSTCMGNGEWEPDPKDVACKGDMMKTEESEVVGGIIGGLIGVIIIVATIIGATCSVIIARRKGFMNWCKHRPEEECYITNTDIELDPTQIIDRESDYEREVAPARGLVYAEIGQSSKKHQPNLQSSFLNLDDDRIEYAQLNHKSLNKKENKPKESDDESLTVNLDNLLIQLKSQVGPKWYQFGEAVGIAKEVLDKFAKQCSPEDCIIEMFDYWLRMSAKQATWRDVAKALKEINLPQLAHGIEGIYVTGKLPIEVDMDSIPQIQQDNFDGEPPPPIPPKMVLQDWGENSSYEPKGSHQMQKMTLEIEKPAPALPPKPNQCEVSIMADVPVRPPKPSIRVPPFN